MSADNTTANNAKTMNALGFAIESVTASAKKDRVNFFNALSNAIAHFVGGIVNDDNAELCKVFLQQFMEKVDMHLGAQDKAGVACIDAVVKAIGELGLGEACAKDLAEDGQPLPDLDKILEHAVGAAIVDTEGNLVRTLSGDELKDFLKGITEGEEGKD